jgi:hypothetical protein
MVVFTRRGALYAKRHRAGKARKGKVFFRKNYTPQNNPVVGSRRALEDRGEEAVRAVHMRP